MGVFTADIGQRGLPAMSRNRKTIRQKLKDFFGKFRLEKPGRAVDGERPVKKNRLDSGDVPLRESMEGHSHDWEIMRSALIEERKKANH